MDRHLVNNIAKQLNEERKLKTDSQKPLDNLDLKIITLLQQDSRLSFNKIAGKLGVSVGTAYNRVRELEENGVVKGYTVILDAEKIGFELTALILIQAVGKHLEEVEAEIAKTGSVIAVYDITGDYDAAIITKFKDRAGLNDFVKNLLSAPHIKRTVTNVALNVIKEDCLLRIGGV
jgi:DNA-binding Lrp family transcriptional regulator